MIMDNLFEFLYFIDMTCCFCQEYLDEETFTEVTDVKQIAIHYVKKSFIFDLLAILPFEMMFKFQKTSRLWRLIKLLRMPRLAELLNVEKVKGFINTFYTNQLIENIREGNDETYPTKKIMLMV